MDNGLVIDRIALKVDHTGSGFLRVPAQIGRTGVQVYKNPDGTRRREYRPADEVFAPASLDTLKLLPLTNKHPPEFLTPQNYQQYAVGTLGENIDRDGQWLKSRLSVSDAQTLKDIENGMIEISLGYSRDVDRTPGTSPEGEPYDLVQRNIRYNHAAILPKGRAGNAKLLMDAAEQITEDQPLTKIKVNGITFEVEPQLAEALAADQKVTDGLLDETAAECDKEKARADVLDSQLGDSKKALDGALSEDAVQEAVKARLGLERLAALVLDGADISEKSAREIQVEVIQKELPDVKVEDQSDAYIEAAFDIATAGRKDALDRAREVGDAARGSSHANGPSQAREALLKRNAERAANSLKGAH